MLCLIAPSEARVQRFLSRQASCRFSYPEVGASAQAVPAHYNLDHSRIRLGHGEGLWRLARQAVTAWKMFDTPWVRLYPPRPSIQVGTTEAVMARHFGVYSLNACRIVYVVDEQGPLSRYGFAYGTLTEHAERGEERFTVEWNRQENSVYYDVLAFSRPHSAWAWLGYPLSRLIQVRFAAASRLAMLRAVSIPE